MVVFPDRDIEDPIVQQNLGDRCAGSAIIIVIGFAVLVPFGYISDVSIDCTTKENIFE